MAQPTTIPFNFANSEAPQLERSSFPRNRAKKLSFDAGYLYPMFLDEVLPGDIYTVRTAAFLRVATLKTPIMDNMYADMHFFYSPNRLLWEHWVQFMGEKNVGSTTEYVVPTIGGDPMNINTGDLGDYLGLPTKVAFDGDEQVSALPFRMYARTFNEWFRDENLYAEIPFTDGDGPDDIDDYALVRRGKRYDFYTALLPWPQKGDAVQLPLGTTAPVIGSGKNLGLTNGTTTYGLVTELVPATSSYFFTGRTGNYGGVPGGATSGVLAASATDWGVTTNAANSGLIADLTAATAATVNDIREAFAMQQYLELDARSGTRYTEILQAQWGQSPQDFRLQRIEYLGGSSQRMGVTQVPQTSESGTTKQASLAAYGQTVASSGFSKSFVEHGWIMGLISIRADMTYQQGLPRMWSRQTKFDFYHPLLAHLGEEPIYRKELYYEAYPSANNNSVFGYGERWNEYRTALSDLAGLFRSNATGTLDFWHLATKFVSSPTLSEEFIVENPDVDRVIAVPSEPQFIGDIFHEVKCTRQIPVYSTPGLRRF